MSEADIAKEIIDKFGRDPIAEAIKRMGNMNKEEIQKLALISMNMIGELVSNNNEVYNFCAGIDLAFQRYDNISFANQATTTEIGRA